MGLSIIIPCYNEYSRGNFNERLENIYQYIKKMDYEVILISDGSTDKTADVIKDFVKTHKDFNAIIDKQNHGKSYVLRKAIDFCVKDYILMMDADLSVPLTFIAKFYDEIDENKCLCASRRCDESIINKDQNAVRQFIGKSLRRITKMSLDLDINDTQCGFKMFPTKNAKKINEFIKSEKWLFDIELLIYLKAQKVEIVEIPVEWNDDLESTIRPLKATISSSKEFINILIHKNKNIRIIKSNNFKSK